MVSNDADVVAAAVACVLTRCSTASRLRRRVGAGRKQRVRGAAGAFGQPDFEHGLGVGGKWDRTLLSALAVAADVRAGAEREVAAVEADEL